MKPDEVCPICRLVGPACPTPELTAATTPAWALRHHALPAPLAGWMLLCARRHVQGPAHLDDDEARDFGILLRDASRAVERATGALRVYAIAYGEGAQHVHVHLVPRLASRPDTAAWKVADWYRAVERGDEPAATESDVRRAIDAVRRELLAAAGGRWSGV